MATATKSKKFRGVDGPLKWHGGKAYLAPKIIELMPPRVKNSNKPADDDPGWCHYVEPYAGGLQVLFAMDPEGISEVVGDAHPELCNFWSVLAHPGQFDDFKRVLDATPFSESLYDQAVKSEEQLGQLFDDRIPGGVQRKSRAVWFFIRCRQSMAGRMKDFAPITRNRTRRGMNEQASAWLNAVDGLPAVHDRLKRVVILNRPALEVIKQQDGPRTLFYLDPPYLHETRTTTKEYGDHEMTVDDHFQLLQVLARIKGRFLLSGYRSDLYDGAAAGMNWRRVDIDIANHSSSKKNKERKTECVWMNY